MKILFLHLSDAHIKSMDDIKEINTHAITSAVAQTGEFDECILIFSGDISYSGTEDEFNAANILIKKILKGINQTYFEGKKHIECIFVPGNHDNVISNANRTGTDISELYKSKKIATTVQDELNQLANFDTFVEHKMFSKKQLVDSKVVNFKNFSIRINMINTAPFSLLGSNNGDKGLHYISKNDLQTFDLDNNSHFTITVMHHGPEWFSDGVKNELYSRIYQSSNLLFVGHEHFSLNEMKDVNGKHIDVSSGMALHGSESDLGFNCVILDTDEKILLGYKCTYCPTSRIYKPELVINNTSVIFRNRYNFTLSKEFHDKLLLDINEREGEQFKKYFVFPQLEAKDINNDMKNISVMTEERFAELLFEKKRISIEGGTRAGKTTLAKYLCELFCSDYVPVLLTPEDFEHTKEQRVMKYAFLNQYGDSADFDAFCQLDSKKKILIVDGTDKISKNVWNSFLEANEKIFGYIISFCDIDFNLNIKEKTLEEFSENKWFYLRIAPFYYSKREQLIKKICELRKDEFQLTNIDEKCKKINEDITNQIKYFQLTPDFIHQFVDYYVSFAHIRTQKETNVFSKVYEANITFRISKCIKTENDIAEIMVALDFVAHYIHFKKKYPLPFGDFETAVNEYKERYDNEELSAKYVLDVAKKANILREVSNKFEVEFCDENLLAYFAACHLNRECNEGSEEGQNDLQFVLNNICFGINGDIILFLSYITSNVQILNPIVNSIYYHMDSWIELNLDECNIDILKKNVSSEHICLPTNADKAKMRQDKNKLEKQLVEENIVEPESLYSYDESKIDSFCNKISKSIRYLELVAKLLPNFRHILTKEQKQAIVGILYSYPNKLLYYMLKDIDSHTDEIIQDVLETYPRTKKGLLITSDMVKREIQNQTMCYILSIYDFISSTSSNEKTIIDLEKFDYRSGICYQMENLLMQENVNNFKAVAQRAEILYESVNLPSVKRMVKMIVRKFFLCHEVPLYGEAQHLIDKMFGAEERKNFQLMQAKNAITKK